MKRKRRPKKPEDLYGLEKTELHSEIKKLWSEIRALKSTLKSEEILRNNMCDKCKLVNDKKER